MFFYEFLAKQAHAAMSAAKEFLALVNDFDNLAGYAGRIKEIESEADHITHELANLLNAPDADPIKVIQWKEIYARIEAAVDKCEDAAHIIESVVVKYA